MLFQFPQMKKYELYARIRSTVKLESKISFYRGVIADISMAALVDAISGNLLWPFVSLFLYVRFWVSFILCLPWIIYAMAVGKSFKAFIEFYAILKSMPLGLGKYVYTGFTGFFSS